MLEKEPGDHGESSQFKQLPTQTSPLPKPANSRR